MKKIIAALAGLALCAFASFRIIQAFFSDSRYGTFGTTFLFISVLLMAAGISLLYLAFKRRKRGGRNKW